MNVVLVGLNFCSGDVYSLSLRFLKGYVRTNPEIRQYLRISIRDFDADIPEARLASLIMDEKPDIIGFSSFLWNMEKIVRTSRILKKSLKNIKIIVGGPQVSARPLELLSKYTSIDVIVKGEGEITFQELLLHYLGKGKSLADIEGIAYRIGVELNENIERPLIMDIDRIPSPYLEEDSEALPGNFALWETFRGCIYNCAYCNWTSKKLRFFSYERLEEELEYFLKNGIERLWLVDSDVSLNRNNLNPLFKKIIESKDSFTQVSAFLNIENLDPSDIELYSQLPFGLLEIGLQSSNPVALRNIRRHWNKKKFEHNWHLMRDIPGRQFNMCADMVIGLPGDNHASFKETMRYVADVLKPDEPSIFILMILRGSLLSQAVDKFKFELEGEHCYWVKSSNTYSQEDMKRSKLLSFAFYITYNIDYEVNGFISLLMKELKMTRFEIIECLAGWLEENPARIPQWYDRFLSFEESLAEARLYHRTGALNEIKEIERPKKTQASGGSCGKAHPNRDEFSQEALSSNELDLKLSTHSSFKKLRWMKFIYDILSDFINHMMSGRGLEHRVEEVVNIFRLSAFMNSLTSDNNSSEMDVLGGRDSKSSA